MTTTKTTINLFPLLHDESSLSYSDNQSKLKSLPSVSSFIMIEKQKQKQNFNEKYESLSLDKEEIINKNSPPTSKQSFHRVENDYAIRMILLSLASKKRIFNATHDETKKYSVNLGMSSSIDQVRSNYQKYFTK